TGAGLNVFCRPDKRSASGTSQYHREQSNILSLHNTSLPAVYAVNPQSEFSVLPPENIRIACDSYVYLYL
ncbi:hypothetical protein, partial [Citrobacter portucalensis]|uniref:hypothetical protein n=1 Tax=Citrobacter portucalensis TaxID=1639133 RepID=UPI002161EABA